MVFFYLVTTGCILASAYYVRNQVKKIKINFPSTVLLWISMYYVELGTVGQNFGPDRNDVDIFILLFSVKDFWFHPANLVGPARNCGTFFPQLMADQKVPKVRGNLKKTLAIPNNLAGGKSLRNFFAFLVLSTSKVRNFQLWQMFPPKPLDSSGGLAVSEIFLKYASFGPRSSALALSDHAPSKTHQHFVWQPHIHGPTYIASLTETCLRAKAVSTTLGSVCSTAAKGLSVAAACWLDVERHNNPESHPIYFL